MFAAAAAAASLLPSPFPIIPSAAPPPCETPVRDTRRARAGEEETRTPARHHHLLSLPRLLKACAGASALSRGRQLHALSFKLRLSSDLYVQTSLLSMYSSCAQPDHALLVFDRMPHRNVVAWTAAVDACLRSDRPDVAFSVFRQMLESGVEADRFALVSLLSACSHMGALNMGRVAHGHVEKKKKKKATTTDVEPSAFVGTALVDMYCKCGSVDDAVAVFDSMPRWARTVQCWNAMLHGLSVHGHGARALRLFSMMESDGGDGVRPNGVTFLALLCGCAHAGLVQEGRLYFDLMKKKYGIRPGVEHYGTMVDLLGRAGLLDEAFGLVSSMPVAPNLVVLGALLSACRIHKDMDMAERVMERIAREDHPVGDRSRYVIMSNMYRQVGSTEKVAEVRARVGKKPKGRSWIEIGPLVHEF